MTLIEEHALPNTSVFPTAVIPYAAKEVLRPTADFWQGMSSRAAFLFGLTAAIAGSSVFALTVIVTAILGGKR